MYVIYGGPQLDGYDYCGSDAAKWAQDAGDPNYNLINECCQQMNRKDREKLPFSSCHIRMALLLSMVLTGLDPEIQLILHV